MTDVLMVLIRGVVILAGSLGAVFVFVSLSLYTIFGSSNWKNQSKKERLFYVGHMTAVVITVSYLLGLV